MGGRVRQVAAAASPRRRPGGKKAGRTCRIIFHLFRMCVMEAPAGWPSAPGSGAAAGWPSSSGCGPAGGHGGAVSQRGQYRVGCGTWAGGAVSGVVDIGKQWAQEKRPGRASAAGSPRPLGGQARARPQRARPLHRQPRRASAASKEHRLQVGPRTATRQTRIGLEKAAFLRVELVLELLNNCVHSE